MTIKTRSITVERETTYRLLPSDVIALMLLLKDRQDFCKAMKRDSPSEDDLVYWESEFMRAGHIITKLTLEFPSGLRPTRGS